MSTPVKTEIIPLKTVLTILLVAVLLAVVPFIPGLQKYGGLSTQPFRALAKVPEAGSAVKPIPAIPLQNAKSAYPTPPAGSPYLFDPHGALDHFYSSLERTAAKEPGAVTLVLHYGDSPVTADSITADARSIFQSRFGDAGHGFVLIAKPWAWYGHRGVEIRARGWKIEAATQSRAKDGFHGLGGVSFTGGPGAISNVTLPDDQHTRAQIFYLEQPDGGVFRVSTAGQTLVEVNTEGPEKKAAFASVSLPPATRDVQLEVSSGKVRLFGYSFEKPGPGVIYSSLGLNGAQVQSMLRFFEVQQWTDSLQHEHPDLIVLNYGTNESVDNAAYLQKLYPSELRQVLDRIRTAAPEASLLVMSPMDRGKREDGEIITPPVLPQIVDIQKRVALEAGWAFFNTFEAMGGSGTMARWYNSSPRLVSADFMHPLPAGAAKVGALLDEALFAGFDGYESKQPRQITRETHRKSDRTSRLPSSTHVK
ncbi:MAG: GDSL-type esterase/lipase family protein [Bryobacteraceae bacterium]